MLYGYRYGQSPAGRRIEAAGNIFLAREAALRLDELDADRIAAIQAALDARDEDDGPTPLEKKLKAIIRETAESAGLRFADLVSTKRPKGTTKVRMLAYYRCAMETGASSVEIGCAINRHYSSVISGIRAHCKRTGAPVPLGWGFRR